eukprot:COSAG06_NODE_39280_length_414_cov_1.107937_2_plen_46_part_01
MAAAQYSVSKQDTSTINTTLDIPLLSRPYLDESCATLHHDHLSSPN